MSSILFLKFENSYVCTETLSGCQIPGHALERNRKMYLSIVDISLFISVSYLLIVKKNVFMWVQSCSCNHMLCKKRPPLIPVITYITPIKKHLLKIMITYEVRVITCRPEFHLRWALWWLKIIKYRKHNVL